jgi:serine/threonine-protein kinase
MESSLLAGRYRLIERIGTGGTAEVWRARDERLGRDVAVKLLHRHLVPDERARARVLAEAHAVASLAHPGIVTIHDVLEEGDRIGLVLELVQGEPLAARIARGPLPPAVAAMIAATLADALEAAHGHGVVHRDVKPANVVLGATGAARLIDFGIAHVVAGQKDVTAPGTVMGTLRWMAPEQLAGASPTPATDIWGLGAVLYAMLAGREPFAAESPAALIAGQRAGPPPIPGAVPELEAVARAALAPDPEGRPSSAAEVGDALRAWLRGAPVATADDPTVTLVPRWGAVRTAAPLSRAVGVPTAAAVAHTLLLLGGIVATALVGAGGAAPDAAPDAAAEEPATASPARTVAPTPSPTPRPTAAAAPAVSDEDDTGGERDARQDGKKEKKDKQPKRGR